MTELMYYYGARLFVVCRGQGIAVVYASAAIIVGIGKNDDAGAWDSPYEVIECVDIECSEVAG